MVQQSRQDEFGDLSFDGDPSPVVPPPPPLPGKPGNALMWAAVLVALGAALLVLWGSRSVRTWYILGWSNLLTGLLLSTVGLVLGIVDAVIARRQRRATGAVSVGVVVACLCISVFGLRTAVHVIASGLELAGAVLEEGGKAAHRSIVGMIEADTTPRYCMVELELLGVDLPDAPGCISFELTNAGPHRIVSMNGQLHVLGRDEGNVEPYVPLTPAGVWEPATTHRIDLPMDDTWREAEEISRRPDCVLRYRIDTFRTADGQVYDVRGGWPQSASSQPAGQAGA